MVMMDLHGKKVLVVGLARTGLATARFLKERGAIVSATEVKGREEVEKTWLGNGRDGYSGGVGLPSGRDLSWPGPDCGEPGGRLGHRADP